MSRSSRADQESDVAEVRIEAAAQHGDGANARLAGEFTPGEVGARHQRARAGNAGALQAGAEEGRAPGHLVVVDLRVADVGVVVEDARVGGDAAALRLAKLGPCGGHPWGLVHCGESGEVRRW